MPVPSIRLLDDPHVRALWSPFAESGCIGRLFFGAKTLRARLEESAPAIAGATLWVTPRFVPSRPQSLTESWDGKVTADVPRAVTLSCGTPIGWLVPDGSPVPPIQWTSGTNAPPPWVVEGSLLHSPWTLMDRNPDQLIRDLKGLQDTVDPSTERLLPGAHPQGVWVVGEAPVTMEAGVILAPQVVFDTSQGPIHLSHGVRVDPFTHLSGPAWIGADTRILGGRLSAVTVGPVGRIRGEVEASVLQPWVNKAHDGFLGHAVLGSWVNLGALTTNSDLKNTYGSVRVPIGPDREEDTGMQKIGVLVGDHVKTGIGTLISTGTVIGVGSNLFAGGPLPPRWVPPFSWVTGGTITPVRYDAFVTVAQRSMARRSEHLAADDEAWLRDLWHRTHGTAGSELL